jgi:hypothetical protein
VIGSFHRSGAPPPTARAEAQVNYTASFCCVPGCYGIVTVGYDPVDGWLCVHIRILEWSGQQ